MEGSPRLGEKAGHHLPGAARQEGHLRPHHQPGLKEAAGRYLHRAEPGFQAEEMGTHLALPTLTQGRAGFELAFENRSDSAAPGPLSDTGVRLFPLPGLCLLIHTVARPLPALRLWVSQLSPWCPGPWVIQTGSGWHPQTFGHLHGLFHSKRYLWNLLQTLSVTLASPLSDRSP